MFQRTTIFMNSLANQYVFSLHHRAEKRTRNQNSPLINQYHQNFFPQEQPMARNAHTAKPWQHNQRKNKHVSDKKPERSPHRPLRPESTPVPIKNKNNSTASEINQGNEMKGSSPFYERENIFHKKRESSETGTNNNYRSVGNEYVSPQSSIKAKRRESGDRNPYNPNWTRWILKTHFDVKLERYEEGVGAAKWKVRRYKNTKDQNNRESPFEGTELDFRRNSQGMMDRSQNPSFNQSNYLLIEL